MPSYTAAYLTEAMVWVVPTLVAGGLIATRLGQTERTSTRVDEDGEEDDE